MSAAQAIKLREFAAEVIRPEPPFCAKTTLLKPSHFPSPFEQIDLNRYRAVIRVGRHTIGVDAWTEETAAVGLRLYRAEEDGDFDGAVVKAEITRRLGLDMRLNGYEALWHGDEILSRLPDEMMGARPSSPFSLYEFLMICVFLQNTTIRRTVSMANALANEIGREVVFPDGVSLRGFWTPEDLLSTGEARLRVLKMGYRAKILERLSIQFNNDPDIETRLLDNTVDRGALMAGLRSLYGIGPASVGYVGFEWFKMPDFLSHISPWELKILSRLLFDSDPVSRDELISFCTSRWAPFQMLAIHAIIESVFWRRLNGSGPEWLNALIRF